MIPAGEVVALMDPSWSKWQDHVFQSVGDVVA